MARMLHIADVGGRMGLDETWRAEAESVAQSAATMARGRAGRLAALTISVPSGVSAIEFARLVEEQLSVVGFDAVDVSTHIGHGPPRVVRAEFER